ncbi:MAG: DNA ligase, partial [Planctomycetales bacterium]
MADLQDGETAEVQGSAAAPYVLKNVGGVYSCTCPAWRHQSLGIERRTCKHLRKYRGEQAEQDRIGQALPPKPKSAATAAEGQEKAVPKLLLAQKWDNNIDLTDWWMSEKLDGVRAFWDGMRFVSRQGNEFHAPDWFVEGFPKNPLDGELWLDRKSFQKTISIVRRQDKSDHWKAIRYMVFDAPEVDDVFEERMNFLRDQAQSLQGKHLEVHGHQRCESLDHLQEELERIEGVGGEGLMLRQPSSKYRAGRSSTLLKVKTFHDAEATVLDHAAGKGRHKGRLGALVAQLPDGTRFNVGTGFSDAQRENPPSVGSTITFRYQELSDGGVPRFPSYVRLHSEAGSAAAPKTTAKKKSTKKTTAAAKSTSGKKSAQTARVRYFEFIDAKSEKFWEVSILACDV